MRCVEESIMIERRKRNMKKVNIQSKRILEDIYMYVYIHTYIRIWNALIFINILKNFNFKKQAMDFVSSNTKYGYSENKKCLKRYAQKLSTDYRNYVN